MVKVDWKEEIEEIESIFGERLDDEDKLMLDKWINEFWDRAREATIESLDSLY